MNENKLTKKECGRINSALNQSRLELFDIEGNLKSKELGDRVCSSMDRCTSDIKRVLDVFLCSTTTNPEYRKLFKTIDSKGVENISGICSKLESKPDALNETTIRTVFGGTEKMPFRAFVYLLPALNMCEELLESGSSSVPNIEYFFMNGAGIITNALDPEIANKESSEFIKIAQKYIEEYHPRLKDKVNFYTDLTFSSNIIGTPEYRKIYETLERKLGYEDDLKTGLIEMGERRKKAENSIKYAAIHSFVHDGCIDSSVAQMSNFFGEDAPKECDTIISIGAKPEEKFYRVRKLLAEEVKTVPYFTPKDTVQYIANINVPPYSPLPEGELYLKDVMQNPKLIMDAVKVSQGEYSEYQTPVQKAVENILDDIAHSDSYKSIIEFIEDYKTLEKDKQK